MIDKNLQKARQDWFLNVVKTFKIDNLQADIAAKTGKSKQTISGYFSGERAITEDFMRTFCKAYGMDFESIYGEMKEAVDIQQNNLENNVLLDDNDMITKDLSLPFTKNQKEGDMMRDVISIMRIDAEARLYKDKAIERLTRMLERREVKEEREDQELKKVSGQ